MHDQPIRSCIQLVYINQSDHAYSRFTATYQIMHVPCLHPPIWLYSICQSNPPYFYVENGLSLEGDPACPQPIGTGAGRAAFLIGPYTVGIVVTTAHLLPLNSDRLETDRSEAERLLTDRQAGKRDQQTDRQVRDRQIRWTDRKEKDR